MLYGRSKNLFAILIHWTHRDKETKIICHSVLLKLHKNNKGII